MIDEFTKVTRHLDLSSMLGLEIGPLYRPRIPPDRGDIRYLDHLSTEGLRAKYGKDPNVIPHLDEIVNVHYVADPGVPLPKVVGADAPFDYVVASHLIEHIANPVAWLREVADILTPTGFLCLVVPDLRYTFDARRLPTTPAQVIDAYLREVTIPTFQQTFDHHYEVTPDIPAPQLWAKAHDLTTMRRYGDGSAAMAMERCEHIKATGDYEDVHCSTFTPQTFLLVFEALARLDLWDFTIVDFYPTEVNEIEFYVTFQKLAPSEDRAAKQLASLRDASAKIEAHEAALQASLPSAGSLDLSPKERALVEFKRRSLYNARRVVEKLTRRG
jgi:SAM-dependent methyltransferase